MAAMYGHRWTSSYGVEDDGTWRKGLAGLSPQQIGAGIVKCLERKPKLGEEDWPPTLTEFRAMCLPERQQVFNRALPPPPQNPNVVERYLTQMWALVK